MQVTFLGQGLAAGSDRAIGDELRVAIQDDRFKYLTAFVAFVSSPAAEILCDLIAKRELFKVALYIGIDQKGTAKEALEVLLKSSAYTAIFFTPSSPIYHPKVYVLSGDVAFRILIGSSNLTKTGLFANVEASMRIDFTKGDVDGELLLKQIFDFFAPITGAKENVQPLTQELIDKLHAFGLVPKEVERAAAQGELKATPEGDRVSLIQKLFPLRKSAPVPAGIAHEKSVKIQKKTSAEATASIETLAANVGRAKSRQFWIETGNMTGGSRNQLDLSRVSRFKRIDGSLSLFGLKNPKTN